MDNYNKSSKNSNYQKVIVDAISFVSNWIKNYVDLTMYIFSIKRNSNTNLEIIFANIRV